MAVSRRRLIASPRAAPAAPGQGVGARTARRGRRAPPRSPRRAARPRRRSRRRPRPGAGPPRPAGRGRSTSAMSQPSVAGAQEGLEHAEVAAAAGRRRRPSTRPRSIRAAGRRARVALWVSASWISMSGLPPGLSRRNSLRIASLAVRDGRVGLLGGSSPCPAPTRRAARPRRGRGSYTVVVGGQLVEPVEQRLGRLT